MIAIRTDSEGRIVETRQGAAADGWRAVSQGLPMLTFARLVADHGFATRGAMEQSARALGWPSGEDSLQYGAHEIARRGPAHHCHYCGQTRPDPDDFWSTSCR